MTRVSRESSHQRPRVPGALDRPRAAAARKKKPYKIVLEAVTQEKRKLQSIVSYHDQAPPGFGFIAVGHPEISEWCKEQCRQRNLDVHIVSVRPTNFAHANSNKLTHHVHRAGHHFPLEIIHLACKKFGYTFDDDRGLRKPRASPSYGEAYFERGLAEYEQKQRLHGGSPAVVETKDYVRGAVREMFPKIPDASLNNVVEHAFTKGMGRVGEAKHLSLARRVQLAVVAHIRHAYTEYDNLLKTEGWKAARRKVEHVSLAKVREWRDEASDGSHELEETFREVIVLDDEEEESSDDDTPVGGEREPSMEVFYSRATARDLQPEPVDRSSGYAPANRVSGRTIILSPMSAIRRSHIPSSSTNRAPQISRAVPFVADPEPLSPRPGRRVELAREPVAREAHPLRLRGSDGRLYNLEPIDESRRLERARPLRSPPRVMPDLRRVEPLYPAPYQTQQPYQRIDAHYDELSRPSTLQGFVRESYGPAPDRSRTLSDQMSRPPLAPMRRDSDQDIVLPSIEREPDSMTSPRRVADASLYPRQDRGSVAIGHAEVRSPRRNGFPPSVQTSQDRSFQSVPPVAKRPRHVYDDDAPAHFRPSGTVIPPVNQVKPAPSPNRSRVQPVQPDYDVIDLTSSPKRRFYGGDSEGYELLQRRPIPGSGSRSYALAPSHEGNVRVVHDQAPLRGLSRAYVPEANRMYDGQTRRLDHASFGEESPHLRYEGGRFHGRHNLH